MISHPRAKGIVSLCQSLNILYELASLISTTLLCLVQVHLGIAMGHGITLTDHQTCSLHKALRPCRLTLGYRPLIEPRCCLMRPWCRMVYVKGLTHIVNLHPTLPILQTFTLLFLYYKAFNL